MLNGFGLLFQNFLNLVATKNHANLMRKSSVSLKQIVKQDKNLTYSAS